ncbi:MAG: PHB depolymerase family esterase [Pseudomonadota bacterium]
MIGERSYRIRMPEATQPGKPVGAVIFNHGYKGTADGLMRNKRLARVVSDMGLAFVAPKSAGDDWDIPNAPFPNSNSDVGFFKDLKKQLVSEHNIDADRIMVTGFSAGGMMVWNLACQVGDQFAAYVPISGTFWAPVPQSCATLPVNLVHIHGTSDKVVPMKGRKILKTHQGDVYKSLDLMARSADFGKWRSMGEANGLTCQQRDSASHMLRLCLHPGGHSFKSEWLRDAWNAFKDAGTFKSG